MHLLFWVSWCYRWLQASRAGWWLTSHSTKTNQKRQLFFNQSKHHPNRIQHLHSKKQTSRTKNCTCDDHKCRCLSIFEDDFPFYKKMKYWSSWGWFPPKIWWLFPGTATELLSLARDCLSRSHLLTGCLVKLRVPWRWMLPWESMIDAEHLSFSQMIYRWCVFHGLSWSFHIYVSLQGSLCSMHLSCRKTHWQNMCS